MSIPTLDSVVPAHSAVALFTADEIEFFQKNGYIISRKLADERLREEMLDATFEGLGGHIEPNEYEADLHYPRESRRLTDTACERAVAQLPSPTLPYATHSP